MNQDFKTWWRREGSGMCPMPDQNVLEHVHRLAEIAWDNGAFKALESASAEAVTLKRLRAFDATAWQPIATAPRDGRAILLWWDCCKDPSVGRWQYDGVTEGFRCDGDECVPKNQRNCTHWQPLPEPPTERAPVEHDSTEATH